MQAPYAAPSTGATTSRALGALVFTATAASTSPIAPPIRPSRAARVGSTRRVAGCTSTPAANVTPQSKPVYTSGARPSAPPNMLGSAANAIAGNPNTNGAI